MSVEIMFFVMKKKNQNDKTLSLQAESPPEGVGRPMWVRLEGVLYHTLMEITVFRED